MPATTDEPANVPATRLDARESALLAAERFLAATVEGITPDTPPADLLRYAGLYRSHLAAVVAAHRHPGTRAVSNPMKTPVRARSRTSQRARTGSR